jgi:hypothetical protein
MTPRRPRLLDWPLSILALIWLAMQWRDPA